MAIAMVAVSTIASQALAAPAPGSTYFRITDREMFCRFTTVTVSRMPYLVPALGKFGAPSSTVLKYEQAAWKLQATACAIPVKSANVLNALTDFGSKWNEVVKAVSRAKGFTEDESIAAIAAQFGYETDRLTSACGAAIEQGLQYVLDGTGSSALHNTVMGPRCDPGATATTIRTQANIVDPQSGYQNCYKQYVDQTSQCGGWAGLDDRDGVDDGTIDENGNGIPDLDEEPTPPPPAPPETDDGEGHPIIDLGVQSAEVAAAAGKALAAAALVVMNYTKGTPAERIAQEVAMAGAGLAIVGEGAKAFFWAARLYEDYLKVPEPHDDRMCPSVDLASRPGFGRQDNGDKTNVIDVMQQCICEAVSNEALARARRGAAGTILGSNWTAQMTAMGVFTMQSTGFCMSSTELGKVECIRYPFGPDDGIKRECRDRISADNGVNDSEIQALCNQVVRCPVAYHATMTSPPPLNSIADYGCKCMSDMTFPGFPGSSNEDQQCQALTCEHGKPFIGPSGGCTCPLAPINPKPTPPDPWF